MVELRRELGGQRGGVAHRRFGFERTAAATEVSVEQGEVERVPVWSGEDLYGVL